MVIPQNSQCSVISPFSHQPPQLYIYSSLQKIYSFASVMHISSNNMQGWGAHSSCSFDIFTNQAAPIDTQCFLYWKFNVNVTGWVRERFLRCPMQTHTHKIKTHSPISPNIIPEEVLIFFSSSYILILHDETFVKNFAVPQRLLI